MDTPKRRGTHRFALRETYVSYLDVEAATEVEAAQKARAFYAAHRCPKDSYSEDGVNAVVDTRSYSLVRKPKSTWKKSQAAARGNDRDAVKRNDVASSEVATRKATPRDPSVEKPWN